VPVTRTPFGEFRGRSWRQTRPSRAPGRFSRGHAEASQRQYRGTNTDVGIGATPYVPARGTLEDRVGDVPRRANASEHVVELVAQPQQGLHGQVVAPLQAQVLHHFREPDAMRVGHGHGSSS
jgi:hypothetical protein